MSLPTRPLLAVYVVWHPALPEGQAVAKSLYEHFRRSIFANAGGGTGLSVNFRFAPAEGREVPLEIDFDSAEAVAVVLLADEAFAASPDWRSYVSSMGRAVDSQGLRHALFPVVMTRGVLSSGAIDRQAIRWDKWTNLAFQERLVSLRVELAYQLSRMLRRLLAHLENPAVDESSIGDYLEQVRVFLSHSKHDDLGERFAKATRNYLHNNTDLASFFDVRNIPPGLHFDEVLMHYISVSAVIVFHTDSFSTREWCRREVLEAKRAGVPLVVANAIVDFEERGFPYMANVPVVRLEVSGAKRRIPMIIAALLDEVLKDFLWRCRIAVVKASAGPRIFFLSRPPELLSLAVLAASGKDLSTATLVYPDPPIGLEEAKLFEAISPTAVLQSYTEWLGEAGA